jgi:hypothetical protein
LKELHIRCNKEIQPNLFPIGLTMLSIRNFQLCHAQIPSKLEHLELLGFNQELKYDLFPPTLKTLRLGNAFNQELTPHIFPITLTKLQFGQQFNKPIKLNVLPPNLLILEFSTYFNQEIKEHILPNSIEFLTFEEDFKQVLNNTNLPINLRELCLHVSYEHNIVTSRKFITTRIGIA